MSAAHRPVEHLHVRRHNLALVLRLLASEGPRSRADISKVTGLTRATVSSLVAELGDRGLVRDLGPGGDQKVGRPATLVELDGSKVVTIGVELNIGYTAVLASDLAGNVVYERRRPMGRAVVDVDEVVPILAAEMRRVLSAVERSGRRVAGMTVAVPGVTDSASGIVTVAPNLGWRGVALLDHLRRRIGDNVPLALDNEANLGAFAEYRVGASAGTSPLIYVLAADGVGGGVMVDGALLRGATGAAGEVGHMTVQPRGSLCACGSRGCWETVIGLKALLASTVPDSAAKLLGDGRLSPEAKVAAVIARANANDQTAIRGLKTFGHWLGVGLANIVDAFNPHTIVLAGFLPDVAPWSMAVAMETFWHNTLVDSAKACRVELSTLGFSAAVRGGAVLAAERVFTDPTVVGA